MNNLEFRDSKFSDSGIMKYYQHAGYFTCLRVARRQGGGTDKLFITPSP
jgi:hypothetical protein